jgi:two-component sensor histidine kinase
MQNKKLERQSGSIRLKNALNVIASEARQSTLQVKLPPLAAELPRFARLMTKRVLEMETEYKKGLA